MESSLEFLVSDHWPYFIAEEWKYSEDAINNLPNAKKKDPLKNFYSLPKYLEDRGFELIYKNLKFNPDKIACVENEENNYVNVHVFTKSTYWNR